MSGVMTKSKISTTQKDMTACSGDGGSGSGSGGGGVVTDKKLC